MAGYQTRVTIAEMEQREGQQLPAEICLCRNHSVVLVFPYYFIITVTEEEKNNKNENSKVLIAPKLKEKHKGL